MGTVMDQSSTKDLKKFYNRLSTLCQLSRN